MINLGQGKRKFVFFFTNRLRQKQMFVISLTNHFLPYQKLAAEKQLNLHKISAGVI